MRNRAGNLDDLRALAGYCGAILSVNAPTQSLKYYIRQLGIFKADKFECKQLCVAVLESLSRVLSADNAHEVFLFPGRESGVLVAGRKELPKEGYCFCGLVNLEAESNESVMTIYRLAVSRHMELKLFISKGHIEYQVICMIKHRCEI